MTVLQRLHMGLYVSYSWVLTSSFMKECCDESMDVAMLILVFLLHDPYACMWSSWALIVTICLFYMTKLVHLHTLQVKYNLLKCWFYTLKVTFAPH